MSVAGTAAGVLTDNTPEQSAYILRNFGGPDEVPILDHHFGRPVGWVTALSADARGDLWFTARLDSEAVADRLRSHPVEVSLEMRGIGMTVPPGERGQLAPPEVSIPEFYRGQPRLGWQLVAVAICRDGDPPASPGSAMFATILPAEAAEAAG